MHRGGYISDLFISNSGELYEFTIETNKLYSNNQISKKIDTDILFDKFCVSADHCYKYPVISIDDQYYYYEKDQLINYKDQYIDYKKINLQYPNNYGIWDNFQKYTYYSVENNCISEIVYDISNVNYKCISNTIIDTIPEGETFIELEGEIIKTDKAYYKIDIKNEEECKMYIDVKPVYGLIKIDDISSDYDNIKYFNGSYIIYKDDMENLYIYN